jgi:hypothetical protein
MRRQRGRIGLMAAALVGLVASGASAEVTTDNSASILVFPKVISNGTRDTVIQITNTSNSMVHAHCFYVNGALTFPFGLDGIPNSGDEVPSEFNPPLWTEIDFDIWLTKQQPTHWLVSEGRLVDPTDEPCSTASRVWTEDDLKMNATALSCNGAGIDPGRVPPVVEYFTGELKCVEVDASGAPLSGNHLKGEATLVSLNVCDPGTKSCTLTPGVPCEVNEQCADAVFDVAKYNAVGILGNEFNNGDGNLCLGGEPDDQDCPTGGEYNACPEFWILNNVGEGAEDPLADSFGFSRSDSSVTTNLTIVPCTQNFESQNPESVTLFIEAWDEYELALSTFAQVTCWADLNLSDIDPFAFAAANGSTFKQVRIRPTNLTQSGVIMVGEEFHEVDQEPTSSQDISSAAMNLHIEGTRPVHDIITIPAEQVQ